MRRLITIIMLLSATSVQGQTEGVLTALASPRRTILSVPISTHFAPTTGNLEINQEKGFWSMRPGNSFVLLKWNGLPLVTCYEEQPGHRGVTLSFRRSLQVELPGCDANGASALRLPDSGVKIAMLPRQSAEFWYALALWGERDQSVDALIMQQTLAAYTNLYEGGRLPRTSVLPIQEHPKLIPFEFDACYPYQDTCKGFGLWQSLADGRHYDLEGQEYFDDSVELRFGSSFTARWCKIREPDGSVTWQYAYSSPCAQ